MTPEQHNYMLKSREGWGLFFGCLSIPISAGVAIAAGRFVSVSDLVTAYGATVFLLAGAAAWGGWLLGDVVMSRVAPHPDRVEK